MKRLFSFLAICALFCSIDDAVAQEMWGTTRYGGANDNGTIFKISDDHTAHIVAYSFSADVIEGINPHGALVQHSNGMLYGFAKFGGLFGRGALFEYNPSTNVYNKKLDLNADIGWNAYGSMIEGSDGKLYGTTSNGGPYDKGVFFEYNPQINEFIVIKAFNYSNGANPMGTPMIASNGKMYVLTVNGGGYEGGTLSEYDFSTLDFTKKVDFTDIGPSGQSPWLGYGPYGSPIEAVSGKLYGVTGGNNEYASIYEYDIATGDIVPRYNFPIDGSEGARVKESLVKASNGKLYGLASEGGVDDLGTVYEFDPSTGAFGKKVDLGPEGLAVPRGSFVELPNGKLIATTSTTPEGGFGAWFEYDPATNTITRKVFFQGTDGSTPDFERLISLRSGISFPPIATRVYGAASFALAATSNVPGVISYTSSDPNVASIVGETVTVHKVGTTIITATQADNSEVAPVQQTLVVKKAPLTVTAETKTKTYGQQDPVFTVTYSGFVTGETVAALSTRPTATINPSSINVGTYTITPGGGVADNYAFNYVTGTLNITRAPLTVTADAKTKIYGDVNPQLTITYSGLVGTETSAVIDVKPTASTTAVTLSNSGQYPITLSSGSDNNYLLTNVNGFLTVQKKVLALKADPKSRAYGSDNPDLTFVYSGFIPNENPSFLDQLPSIKTVATSTTNAGEYDITPFGGSDNNYSFDYQSAKLTITKVTLAVKADNASRTYGTINPDLNLSYVGFVLNDDIEDLDELPYPTTEADRFTDAGEYNIDVAGGSDNNYILSYHSGRLQVNKASVAVKPDDQSRLYGANDPEFTVTYQGLLNDETPDVIDEQPEIVSDALVGSHPGNYKISASNASDNNYNFLYLDGSLLVTKAPLTVIPGDASREFDQSNPTFSLLLTGFVNGDTEEDVDQMPHAFTATDLHSPVGDYEITSSGGSDNDYEFTYESGTLSVVKAHQEILFEEIADKSIGESPFTLIAGASSGLTVAFASESPNIKIESKKLTILAAGRAVVTASQDGNENYLAAASMERSFCINPVKPSIDVTIAENPVLKSSSEFGNQWYLDGELIEDATGEKYTTSKAGNYTVQVTVDDCASPVSAAVPVVITGDIHETISLRMYPNPATNVLHVDGLTSQAKFSIMDMSGKSHPVVTGIRDQVHEIYVNDLAAGMYILNVQSGDLTKNIKFTKN